MMTRPLQTCLVAAVLALSLIGPGCCPTGAGRTGPIALGAMACQAEQAGGGEKHLHLRGLGLVWSRGVWAVGWIDWQLVVIPADAPSARFDLPTGQTLFFLRTPRQENPS